MIREFHKQIESGKDTFQSHASGFLAAAKERNRKINAYITICEDSALAWAAELDKRKKNGEKLGILAGVPGA